MDKVIQETFQLKKRRHLKMIEEIQIFKEYLDGTTLASLGKKHKLAMTDLSQFHRAWAICDAIRYCILEMVQKENLVSPKETEIDKIRNDKEAWHLLADELAKKYQSVQYVAPPITSEADAMGREHIAKMENTPGYYD
jgi:hypothetical protein